MSPKQLSVLCLLHRNILLFGPIHSYVVGTEIQEHDHSLDTSAQVLLSLRNQPSQSWFWFLTGSQCSSLFEFRRTLIHLCVRCEEILPVSFSALRTRLCRSQILGARL